MYLPQPFTEPRIDVLHRIIRDNALGMLVRHTPAGLEVDHLPFLLEADPCAGAEDESPAAAGSPGTLLAHVARANPLVRELQQRRERQDDSPVLVVFRGVQAYVSPNWYPGKHETHRRVPTWNYEVVHAHGRIVLRDDERFVRSVVARLTQRHEADQPQPWKMGDAPADYLSQQLGQIAGIQVCISRLEGKRKLSQHHEPRDRAGAIQGLEAGGNPGLAQAMRDAGPPTR